MDKTTVFRTNADGSIVCDHRDVSCCAGCAEHPLIVDVFGAHFLVADDVERAALLAELHV